jgi:hypothetical protein
MERRNALLTAWNSPSAQRGFPQSSKLPNFQDDLFREYREENSSPLYVKSVTAGLDVSCTSKCDQKIGGSLSAIRFNERFVDRGRSTY